VLDITVIYDKDIILAIRGFLKSKEQGQPYNKQKKRVWKLIDKKTGIKRHKRLGSILAWVRGQGIVAIVNFYDMNEIKRYYASLINFNASYYHDGFFQELSLSILDDFLDGTR